MTNNQRLFLDVHIIQTLPPANINRDDTGSPKTAQYGGTRRARVSSQAWKKAMRKYFYDHSEQNNVGVRTLLLVEYIAKKIVALKNDLSMDEAINLANKVLNHANVKTTKDNKVKALFFLSDLQAQNLAKAAIDDITDKDKLREILTANPAIDIALFGRMVADDPSLNEDASAQVAHAISTHPVENEFDFFTAMDDLQATDQAGAGMLGSVEFNSSTLYRYANVAVHQLLLQLDNQEMVVNALKLFIESFANSLPTGKANTFGNQTLPQFLMVNLRADRPVSLVSAFEEPVKAQSGHVAKSITKLAEEFSRSSKFVSQPLSTMYVTAMPNDALGEVGEEKTSLAVLLNDFATKLKELI